MVSPIYLIAGALLVAFLLGVVDRLSRRLTIGLTLATLAWMVLLSAGWLAATAGGGAAEVLTAGFRPPLSINLRMGLVEAVATLVVNLGFLGSAIMLARRFAREGIGAQILLLMMAMGSNGIILTRDLFNLFVFLEIAAIATYGMIALEDDGRTLSAGFKYIIAGGISSALLLLGTAFLYRLTGTLNIDGMITAAGEGAALAAGVGLSATFLIAAALLIELKVFPANGWALDVYEAAHPAVAAVISAGTATAMVVALDKVAPLMPAGILELLAAVGFVGFAASNLIGMRQNAVRRMLGYSSVAQIALVSGIVAAGELSGAGRATTLGAAGALLVNHALAKAGLFWVAGSLTAGTLDAMAGRLRGRYGLALATGALTVALAGLPPFAGFFGKWQLAVGLAGAARWGWIAIILAGSLFEAAYLFRFLGAGFAAGGADARDSGPAERSAAPPPAGPSGAGAAGGIVPGAAALLALAAGLGTAAMQGAVGIPVIVPVFAGLVGLLLDWLPARVKAALLVAGAAGYAAFLLPVLSPAGELFLLIIPVGAALLVCASLRRGGRQAGFYPLLAVFVISMSSLLVATSALAFLVAFELMTVSSYLLLVRRPRAAAAAERYIVFSLGGAFLLLAGLAALVAAGSRFVVPTIASPVFEGGPAAVASALGIGASPSLLVAFGLIAAGFLVKLGAAGVHLWLPSAYGEAEGETAALFSAVMSKVPLVGLLVVVLAFVAALGTGGPAAGPAGGGLAVLAWVGMLTALFGALLAVFQEDAKYLLAYSSMSQLGYIVTAFAVASGIGWTAGLYLTLLHFAVKGMLFLALAGVLLRTGRTRFHELGGLITRMPLTFVSVLIAIIGVSGVPPLAGFGGKWLLYSALLEGGEYLLAALAFFASTIAFLYLFKLIHAVFLGQLKDDLRGTREAPAVILLPQLVLLGAVMGASMFPELVLGPITAAVAPYFETTLVLERYTVFSTLGYWNGSMVMYVTMAVFVLPLLWLVLVMRRPQRVEQFNIVYAAERPDRPETTHYAHNFFAHYYRALGGLTAPGVLGFWRGVREAVAAGGSALRRLYTGNGQTYAIHILLFIAVLYVILGGAT
jgi:formate hydrogenlyase subunit 3/multisubunit Na+/H+ antiporter MnhD subunit